MTHLTNDEGARLRAEWPVLQQHLVETLRRMTVEQFMEDAQVDRPEPGVVRGLLTRRGVLEVPGDAR